MPKGEKVGVASNNLLNQIKDKDLGFEESQILLVKLMGEKKVINRQKLMDLWSSEWGYYGLETVTIETIFREAWQDIYGSAGEGEWCVYSVEEGEGNVMWVQEKKPEGKYFVPLFREREIERKIGSQPKQREEAARSVLRFLAEMKAAADSYILEERLNQSSFKAALCLFSNPGGVDFNQLVFEALGKKAITARVKATMRDTVFASLNEALDGFEGGRYRVERENYEWVWVVDRQLD